MPPRRPPRTSAPVRRRRLAVLGAAAVAFLVGAVLGAGGGERPARDAGTPERPGERAARASGDALAQLSLEQQVGQLIVLRFAGTTAPGYVRRALRRDRAAGAILFRDNATGPDQVRALTHSLHAAAPRSPLVCIDQEGGTIRILPWAPPQASQPEQTAAGTVAADARKSAAALADEGINVALGPVADVPDVSGSAMAGREFSRDPETAAAHVAAAVRGWRAGGVLPTLKHFPGLGGATVNTDFGAATVARTRAQLDADLAPFRAGLAAGAPLVMLSHAVYPALDAKHIASQSPAVAHSLLRDELGFRGVSMTDSLEAAAVRAVTPDPGAAAVASIGAGVDLILTTGRGSYIRVQRALLAKARSDAAFRARVRESAARVLALRGRL